MPREREREAAGPALIIPNQPPLTHITYGHASWAGITITARPPPPPLSRFAVKRCTQRLLGGESRHHNAPACPCTCLTTKATALARTRPVALQGGIQGLAAASARSAKSRFAVSGYGRTAPHIAPMRVH